MKHPVLRHQRWGLQVTPRTQLSLSDDMSDYGSKGQRHHKLRSICGKALAGKKLERFPCLIFLQNLDLLGTKLKQDNANWNEFEPPSNASHLQVSLDILRSTLHWELQPHSILGSLLKHYLWILWMRIQFWHHLVKNLGGDIPVDFPSTLTCTLRTGCNMNTMKKSNEHKDMGAIPELRNI